jgi:predicted dehydrogenase
VSVHGINGASIGVQTDGGAMFIAGMTKEIEAPFVDLWTIPGEENRIAQWKQEDAAFFRSVDPVAHFHRLQVEDFLQAIIGGRPPAVGAAEGRRVVELFTAIYRSSRGGGSVKFPLAAD